MDLKKIFYLLCGLIFCIHPLWWWRGGALLSHLRVGTSLLPSFMQLLVKDKVLNLWSHFPASFSSLQPHLNCSSSGLQIISVNPVVSPPTASLQSTLFCTHCWLFYPQHHSYHSTQILPTAFYCLQERASYLPPSKTLSDISHLLFLYWHPCSNVLSKSSFSLCPSNPHIFPKWFVQGTVSLLPFSLSLCLPFALYLSLSLSLSLQALLPQWGLPSQKSLPWCLHDSCQCSGFWGPRLSCSHSAEKRGRLFPGRSHCPWLAWLSLYTHPWINACGLGMGQTNTETPWISQSWGLCRTDRHLQV